MTLMYTFKIIFEEYLKHDVKLKYLSLVENFSEYCHQL